MSEVKQLLNKWNEGYKAEFEASGSRPEIAILGHLTFCAFRVAIQLTYGDIPMIECDDHDFVWKGVTCYQSFSMEEGIIFASTP